MQIDPCEKRNTASDWPQSLSNGHLFIYCLVEDSKSSFSPLYKSPVYKRKEKINKNNPDLMLKNTKKPESTMNRNQESGNVQKQNKFSILTLNSNNKEGTQLSIKKTDDARDVHPWRIGTTSIGMGIVSFMASVRKCQNGSVKVRVFSGTTIEVLRGYYIKPLLLKQPSKVLLHVGTNTAT